MEHGLESMEKKKVLAGGINGTSDLRRTQGGEEKQGGVKRVQPGRERPFWVVKKKIIRIWAPRRSAFLGQNSGDQTR